MNEHDVLAVVRSTTVQVLEGIVPETVTIDGTLSDLGANSIDRVDIATLSMEELGVTIPPARFAEVTDVRSLVGLLASYT